MKVIWFSVTPISLNAEENTGIEGKGWIPALLEIALGIDNLELVVVYGNHSPIKKEPEERGRLKVIPINVSRYSKRQIIKDMMTSREVDDYVIGEAMKIIHENKPDLIHVFGTEWCYGLLTKHVSKLNIPVVIHVQGLWSQIRNSLLLPGQSTLFDRIKPELWNHPLGFFARYQYYNLSMERHRREEEILRNNRYFMCRTRWDQAVVRFYNKDARIFHVDEALRREFVECRERWSLERRREEDKEKRRIVLVTTGACYSIKGPDVVLKTAKLIRENTGYEVEWKWIGGTEDDMREFEKLTKVNAREVGVRMMGTLSATEMIRELLSSDMYVHTSYSDNSPNAVCEAQYIGMPVIATDTGGVVSLFSNQYDRNMLVPMNDPFYLASKMIELREDVAMAKRLAEDNRMVAHQRHDRERIKKQLKECYEECTMHIERGVRNENC
jgi:glycosyltransferase involved in cell wall biosynthesis